MTNVWLSVDPLAEKYPIVGSYVYCMSNPVKYIDPDGKDIIYFNLKGREVNRVEQSGPDVKQMVLTTNKDIKSVNTAIDKGYVVSAISNSEIAKIGKIYETAEDNKTETEQGFVRGTNGESKIITGAKAAEIGSEQWSEARADVAANGSSPTSDVHLHPKKYDAAGNLIMYGKPEGSGTDINPNNNRGYTEPSLVLGYKEQPQSQPTGQIGGQVQYDYIPMVGFYNTNNNQITTIPLSDLQSTVNKINKQ